MQRHLFLSKAVVRKIGASGEISKDEIQVDCDYESKQLHRVDSPSKLDDGKYLLSTLEGPEYTVEVHGSAFAIVQ